MSESRYEMLYNLFSKMADEDLHEICESVLEIERKLSFERSF